MQKLLQYLKNNWGLLGAALAGALAYNFAKKLFPGSEKIIWAIVICYFIIGASLVTTELLMPKRITLARARRGIEAASQHIEEMSELATLRSAIASHWKEMHDKEALLTYDNSGDLRGMSAPRSAYNETQEVRLDNHYRYCATAGIRENMLCRFMPKTRMLLAPGLSIKIALATFAKTQRAAMQ